MSWQAKANLGYDFSQFQIDWEGRRVTCPEGKSSRPWPPSREAWGNSIIHAEFAPTECLACPARPHCTRAKTEGRELTLRPRERHEA